MRLDSEKLIVFGIYFFYKVIFFRGLLLDKFLSSFLFKKPVSICGAEENYFIAHWLSFFVGLIAPGI